MDPHTQCLGASLDGIAAVKNLPDRFFVARYDEDGRQNACFTLFAVIPHDKEQQLYEAVTGVLSPEKEGA